MSIVYPPSRAYTPLYSHKGNVINSGMSFKDSNAYWISPAGQILSVYQSHIREVLDMPEAFGYSKDELANLYKKFNEPIGFEGKARQQIMEALLGRGWIRLRFVAKNDSWTIELNRLGKRQKEYLWAWAVERSESFPSQVNQEVRIIELSSGVTTDMSLSDMAGSKLLSSSLHKNVEPLIAVNSGADLLDIYPFVKARDEGYIPLYSRSKHGINSNLVKLTTDVLASIEQRDPETWELLNTPVRNNPKLLEKCENLVLDGSKINSKDTLIKLLKESISSCSGAFLSMAGDRVVGFLAYFQDPDKIYDIKAIAFYDGGVLARDLINFVRDNVNENTIEWAVKKSNKNAIGQYERVRLAFNGEVKESDQNPLLLEYSIKKGSQFNKLSSSTKNSSSFIQSVPTSKSRGISPLGYKTPVLPLEEHFSTVQVGSSREGVKRGVRNKIVSPLVIRIQSGLNNDDIKVAVNKVKRFLDRVGAWYKHHRSKKSDSEYFLVERPNDRMSPEVDVRVSEHTLPSVYQQPDLDIDPESPGRVGSYSVSDALGLLEGFFDGEYRNIVGGEPIAASFRHIHYLSDLIRDTNIQLNMDRDYRKYLSDGFFESEVYKLIHEKGVPALIEMSHEFPVKNILISDIVTEQTWYYPSLLSKKLEEDSYEPISVLQGNGKYLLIDGNHRLIASILKGKSNINAHVIGWEFVNLENISASFRRFIASGFSWKEKALHYLDKAVNEGYITKYAFNKSVLAKRFWDKHAIRFAMEDGDSYPYSTGHIYFETPDGDVGAWLGSYKEFVQIALDEYEFERLFLTKPSSLSSSASHERLDYEDWSLLPSGRYEGKDIGLIESATIKELLDENDRNPEFTHREQHLEATKAQGDSEITRCYASTVELRTKSEHFATNKTYYRQWVLFRDFIHIAKDKKIKLEDAADYAINFCDVSIRCQCPDFLYRGYSYMGDQLGYLYGIPREKRFPKKNNPDLKLSCCKHCDLALEHLQKNKEAIIKMFSLYYKRLDETEPDTMIAIPSSVVREKKEETLDDFLAGFDENGNELPSVEEESEEDKVEVISALDPDTGVINVDTKLAEGELPPDEQFKYGGEENKPTEDNLEGDAVVEGVVESVADSITDEEVDEIADLIDDEPVSSRLSFLRSSYDYSIFSGKEDQLDFDFSEVKDPEFEKLHPRAEDGKFTDKLDGGSVTSGVPDEETPVQVPLEDFSKDDRVAKPDLRPDPIPFRDLVKTYNELGKKDGDEASKEEREAAERYAASTTSFRRGYGFKWVRGSLKDDPDTPYPYIEPLRNLVNRCKLPFTTKVYRGVTVKVDRDPFKSLKVGDSLRIVSGDEVGENPFVSVSIKEDSAESFANGYWDNLRDVSAVDGHVGYLFDFVVPKDFPGFYEGAKYSTVHEIIFDKDRLPLAKVVHIGRPRRQGFSEYCKGTRRRTCRVIPITLELSYE